MLSTTNNWSGPFCSTMINLLTASVFGLRDLWKRLRWYKLERRVNNESSTVHYRRLPSKHVELKTKRDRSRMKKATNKIV